MLLGLIPVLIANAAHGFLLPFADVTLFTTTCAIAILFNMFLSIKFLNEKFVCKYDITAVILIAIGSILTIFQMNTTILFEYDRVLIKKLLLSTKSLCLMCG